MVDLMPREPWVDYKGHVFQAFGLLDGPDAKCVNCGQVAATWDKVTPCPAVTQEVEPTPQKHERVELTKPEELALLVGAALGSAYAERDAARAMLEEVVRNFPDTSWAEVNAARDAAIEFIQAYRAEAAVGSPQTPDQTGDAQ